MTVALKGNESINMEAAITDLFFEGPSSVAAALIYCSLLVKSVIWNTYSKYVGACWVSSRYPDACFFQAADSVSREAIIIAACTFKNKSAMSTSLFLS